MVHDGRHPLARTGTSIAFLGGAGAVTGSKFLVETPSARVLVDCGLFQGLKELRRRNWEPFPVPPASVDAVLLTHAHVDHVGYLPLLTRNGFAGAAWATPGTAALTEIVLPDSGHLQEEEADYANRSGFTRHQPALPLYTEADARACLGQLRDADFDQAIEVADGIGARFRRAGHILGSATIELTLPDGATVVFSGDLGRPSHPLLRPPDPPGAPDVLVVESTYGGRRHDDAGVVERLGEAIRRTASRGGTVLIPAFAVDRTEIVLYHLARLMDAGAVPQVPVFVDSPMALASLAVYRRAITEQWPELRRSVASARGDPFDAGTVVEVRDVEASKQLDRNRFPSIIVSASGMATGGRVLHHLAHRLGDPRNSVLLVGFQAAGTRGRALADGARSIKLLGRYVPVRAEVVDVPALSVHADGDELLHWVASAAGQPDAVYAVHGEPASADALCAAVADRTGWLAVAPRHLERVAVSADREARRSWTVVVDAPGTDGGSVVDATVTIDGRSFRARAPVDDHVPVDRLVIGRALADLAKQLQASDDPGDAAAPES